MSDRHNTAQAGTPVLNRDGFYLLSQKQGLLQALDQGLPKAAEALKEWLGSLSPREALELVKAEVEWILRHEEGSK